MVFVDTGAWFAWFVPDDPNHERISTWFAANSEPFLTTDYCIDETLTLLTARGRLQHALDAGFAFFHEDLTNIHFLTPNQIHRAWLLFRQRALAGWSFTDCTSKVVIDDLQIAKAVALDQHFRQFGNVIIEP